MVISRSRDLGDIADLGLTLPEGKQLLARVQQAVVTAQAHGHVVLRPNRLSCGGGCHIKDWRLHQVATLFGTVAVRLPRFRCASCGHSTTCISWPSHCRSTPELDQLRAHLSALMPYRVAAGVLTHLLPVDAGTSPETLRGHTLKIGEHLREAPAVKPATAASAITVTVDSTFIRGCQDGERHLEVRVGNVETSDGGRQVFGAVARTDTDIAALIRRSLETVGRTADTVSTAFTDGCPGLRSILAEAGVTKPPIADWFHIAMRLEHAKLAASGLSTDEPGRAQAKTAIVAEVERLHWRIWNGKARNAHHARADPQGHARLQGRARSSHDGRAIPQAVARVARGRQLSPQPERPAQLRRTVSCRPTSSVTKGTANFLVNRRMNKVQQMRWSRRGADLLLQVRCAVYNGAFGSGFGHLFEPVSTSGPPLATAA